MKKRTMKFNQLELMMEKVFNLRKDIDMLYRIGFKHVVKAVDDSLKRGAKTDSLKRILQKANPDMNTKGYHILANYFSYDLQTKEATEAAEIKPIKISLELGNRGNLYRATRREIIISIPDSVIEIFDTNSWDKDVILDAVRGEKAIFNEISEFKLKGTINHELSHWIRNAQTGHIDKFFKKADAAKVAGGDKGYLKAIRQGEIGVIATSYELDAYIHNIMEYRKFIGDNKYNKKTLEDMFVEIPSLRSVKIHFKTYKYGDGGYLGDWEKKWIDWQKRLIKRLDREKMLGKRMRNIDKKLL